MADEDGIPDWKRKKDSAQLLKAPKGTIAEISSPKKQPAPAPKRQIADVAKLAHSRQEECEQVIVDDDDIPDWQKAKRPRNNSRAAQMVPAPKKSFAEPATPVQPPLDTAEILPDVEVVPSYPHKAASAVRAKLQPSAKTAAQWPKPKSIKTAVQWPKPQSIIPIPMKVSAPEFFSPPQQPRMPPSPAMLNRSPARWQEAHPDSWDTEVCDAASGLSGEASESDMAWQVSTPEFFSPPQRPRTPPGPAPLIGAPVGWQEAPPPLPTPKGSVGVLLDRVAYASGPVWDRVLAKAKAHAKTTAEAEEETHCEYDADPIGVNPKAVPTLPQWAPAGAGAGLLAECPGNSLHDLAVSNPYVAGAPEVRVGGGQWILPRKRIIISGSSSNDTGGDGDLETTCDEPSSPVDVSVANGGEFAVDAKLEKLWKASGAGTGELETADNSAANEEKQTVDAVPARKLWKASVAGIGELETADNSAANEEKQTVDVVAASTAEEVVDVDADFEESALSDPYVWPNEVDTTIEGTSEDIMDKLSEGMLQHVDELIEAAAPGTVLPEVVEIVEKTSLDTPTLSSSVPYSKEAETLQRLLDAINKVTQEDQPQDDKAQLSVSTTPAAVRDLRNMNAWEAVADNLKVLPQAAPANDLEAAKRAALDRIRTEHPTVTGTALSDDTSQNAKLQTPATGMPVAVGAFPPEPPMANVFPPEPPMANVSGLMLDSSPTQTVPLMTQTQWAQSSPPAGTSVSWRLLTPNPALYATQPVVPSMAAAASVPGGYATPTVPQNTTSPFTPWNPASAAPGGVRPRGEPQRQIAMPPMLYSNEQDPQALGMEKAIKNYRRQMIQRGFPEEQVATLVGSYAAALQNSPSK